MKDLTNKVVWITGASSGIGEALAEEFAKLNCKLILSARRVKELERVKNNLTLPEQNVLLLPFDLSDTSKVEELTNQAVHHFGRIDILINNGGISQRSWAVDTSLDIDRKVFEVNYFGTIALTKSVLPIMVKQKGGDIIVISSIAGKFGFYLRSSYSAAKHALIGFFESLRLEVAQHNINVLIVCPGKIKTNISLNAITEKGATHNKMDEAHTQGMPAETCAIKIIEGLQKNKREIYIGNKEIIAVYIKRLFPTLFFHFIKKQKIE